MLRLPNSFCFSSQVKHFLFLFIFLFFSFFIFPAGGGGACCLFRRESSTVKKYSGCNFLCFRPDILHPSPSFVFNGLHWAEWILMCVKWLILNASKGSLEKQRREWRTHFIIIKKKKKKKSRVPISFLRQGFSFALCGRIWGFVFDDWYFFLDLLCVCALPVAVCVNGFCVSGGRFDDGVCAVFALLPLTFFFFIWCVHRRFLEVMMCSWETKRPCPKY